MEFRRSRSPHPVIKKIVDWTKKFGIETDLLLKYSNINIFRHKLLAKVCEAKILTTANCRNKVLSKVGVSDALTRNFIRMLGSGSNKYYIEMFSSRSFTLKNVLIFNTFYTLTDLN